MSRTSGTRKEEKPKMTATPTNEEYVASLKDNFRLAFDCVKGVDTDASTALMTPMLISATRKATIDDLGEEDAKKYFAEKLGVQLVFEQGKADQCFGQKHVAMAYERLNNIGLLDIADFKTKKSVFLNFSAEMPEVRGEANQSVTLNGVWIDFTRDIAFLVGYKSPFRNGEGYMSPCTVFAEKNANGAFHIATLGEVVGKAKFEGNKKYTVDDMEREYNALFKYGVFAQTTVNGNFSYPSKSVCEKLIKLLPQIFETGADGFIARLKWIMANNLCSEEADIETEPLTDKEADAIEWMAFDDVVEEFVSNYEIKNAEVPLDFSF